MVFRRLARSHVLNSTSEAVLLDWNGEFPVPPAKGLLIRVVGRCGVYEDYRMGVESEVQVREIVAKIQRMANQSESYAQHCDGSEVASVLF